MKTDDMLRQVLAEEAQRHAGHHLQPGEMLDYAAGRTDEEASRRVRDHLAACKSCVTAYLELAPLAEADPPPQDNVTDFATAAGWRELQGRLAAERRPQRWWARPRFAWSAAASVLVAVVGLSGGLLSLDGRNQDLETQLARLSEPQADPPFLFLDAPARDAGTYASARRPDESRGHVFLVITIPTFEPLPSYRIELLDADSVVWTGRLTSSEHGTLRLAVPSRLLPTGDYRARLFEPEGGGETLGEYVFRIEPG